MTCPLASSPVSHHPQPDMLRPHSLKESKINAIIVAAVLPQLGFEIWSRSKYAMGQSCQPWEALNGSGFDILRSKPAYDNSSTAQGGGGSFKNRKPIVEVGCCESRMAERSH